MSLRKITLVISLLFLPFLGLAENSVLSDSLYLEKVADELISKLQRQIEINKVNENNGRGHENNYVIFGDADDSFFKMESINQTSGKPLWNEQHTGITQVKEALTAFNSRPNEPVKYYVLVASIYNFYNFNETISKNPDWSKMPGYKEVKENKPRPYAETNSERTKTFFFKVLKSKIENLAGNNIVHIAASFYIPLPQKVPTDKKYALFHHQAISFANLESYQSAAIQLALGSAERTINTIKEKEAWLSSAVDFAINQYKNAKAPESSGGYSTNLTACTATSLDVKIKSFKDLFETDYRMKPQLYPELQEKTENYFIYKPAGFDVEHEKEYAELDNKMNSLYREWAWEAASKGTSDETLFYTVIQDIGCKLDNPDLINSLSQKIYEQSSLKGKKVILISVPYYHVSISPDRYEVGKASIFDNTGLLNTNLAFTTANSVPGVIQSVYKQIKKPYHRYDVRMDVEGSVTHTERHEENVTGYNSMHDVNLWIKPEFYEFTTLKYPDEYCDACVDIIPGDRTYERVPNKTKHLIEIIKYTMKRNDILSRAESSPNNWQYYQPEVKLKEWCADTSTVMAYARQQFEQKEFRKWLENAYILVGAGEVDQSCLVNFNAMGVVDPVVYGIVDVASFIPLVDEVAEGVGLLYAGARGDEENAVIYLVGLGLPAGATVAIKATYKTGKIMIKGVLYVVENGKVLLEKVITNADELKDLLRNLMRFKDNATAIPDNQLTQILDIVNTSDAQVKNQIDVIARKDISDAAKLDELSKITKIGDELLSTIKKLEPGVKSRLDNETLTAFGNSLENQKHLWISESGIASLQKPTLFLEETGNNLWDLVIDSRYYVKYDYSNGRMLLGDLDGNYLAFVQETKIPVLQPGQFAENVIESHLKESVTTLKNLIGLNGTKSINLLGKAISTNPSKVTTILGRFQPDVKNLFSELGNFKNTDLGEIPGGINLLNRPDIYSQIGEWWATHNQPWLKNAVDRGDDIYLATWHASKDELINLTTKELKGAYPKELQYLVQKDYKPKNVSDEQWSTLKTWFNGVGSDLLTAEGKFIDNVLEGDYQKYLTRKSNTGKAARGRLDWKEARDYWLNDSPLARGNNFNSKARLESWYPYDEVHLSNGKRVDSYKPPKNGQEGEIISRKATSLDEIEVSTFEAYLKEMKSKYASGTSINSPKYSPALDNQVLQGKQILEIPSTNQVLPNIQQFIDLANQYKIEIRFRPE